MRLFLTINSFFNNSKINTDLSGNFGNLKMNKINIRFRELKKMMSTTQNKQILFKNNNII